ncbi:MAG: hypothetical protein V1926_06330 [Candidatus Peregrinibacteria bacterium]
MDIFILSLLSLFVLALLLTLLSTVLGFLFVHVPYVPTSWKTARAMVEAAGLKGTETVYDLGAGDGRILITAKRLHPSIRAIGVELVPVVWLLGKVFVWWYGHPVSLRLGNALSQDLRDADCIFVYLITDVMPRFQKKFDAELRKGTTVVSHAFRFPGHTPEREFSVQGIFGPTRVLVYRW